MEALFLVFDFGGVITTSAFPGMAEYSEYTFDRAVAALPPPPSPPSSGTSGAELAVVVVNRLRPFARAFFSAVNKFDAYLQGDAKPGAFQRLELGQLSREEYLDAFPEMAQRCIKGFFRPHVRRLARTAQVPEGPLLDAHTDYAVTMLETFAKQLDIHVLLSVLERSPLRENVMDLLLFVREAADRARPEDAAVPIRLGLITNNWEGMGVQEGLADLLRRGHRTGVFHAVVESCKVHQRKPGPAIFAEAHNRLLVALPPDRQPSSTKAIDWTFFDDLKPNLTGALEGKLVTTAVRVRKSRSVYEGVLAALQRVGHTALAAECRSKFDKRFPIEDATGPAPGSEAVQGPIRYVVTYENVSVLTPLPAPKTPNLLPTHAIPEKQRFSSEELQRLLRWLSAACPLHFPMHLQLTREGGAPIIEYFKGGMSNPTFRLTLRTGSYVLRKQPKGKLLKGAHDVEREYQIMQHLASTSSTPVPFCPAFCGDLSILGTPFYVMRFVPGTILRDPRDLLKARAPEVVIFGLVDALVKLHRAGPPPSLVRIAPSGTASAASTSTTQPHPLLRLVDTWSRQYARANAQLAERAKADPGVSPSFDVPQMLQLGDALRTALTATAEKGARVVPLQPPTLCHGDYKIDNMIVRDAFGTSPKVLALLDFELAHVGDPLADLGYFCLLYHLPPPRGLWGVDDLPRTLPTMADVVERYCSASGLLLDRAPEERLRIVLVYSAAACHKLAGIAHGVCVRARLGNASDVAGGLKLAGLVRGVSILGLGLLRKAKVSVPQAAKL